MPDIIERLRGVPLFSGLSPENLRLVAGIVSRTQLPRGVTIVRQADMGDTMFIIDAGEVVALAVDERGQQTPPRFLYAGASWGETSLLIGEPRDATMKVKESVDLLYIHKADFDRLLEEHSSLWDQLSMRRDVAIKLKAPHFNWLSPDERVEWFSHKHWIVLVRSVATITMLWVIAMLGVVFLARALTLVQTAMVALGLLALVSPWVVWSYLDWINDYHIVTNLRAVHIERVILQYLSRAEAPLDKIQNTDFEQHFFGNVLDYAQLRINTAGKVTGHVDFAYVPTPTLVSNMLTEQMRRYRLRQQSREENEIQHLLQESIYPNEAELPEETADGAEAQANLKSQPAYDPLSLLVRGRGISRLIVETGLFSFIMRPHLPRLGVITEGKSLIWRKHWTVLLGQILAPTLLFLVVTAFTVATLVFPISGSVRLAAIAIGLAAMGVSFFWLFYRYENWRNDIFVVSDTQIIDIVRTPLLARESSRRANLDMIQDIHFVVPNFFSSVVDRGDVVIETAGQGQFIFDHVMNPSQVQRVIFARVDELRQRRADAERKQRENELAQWFAIYNQEVHGQPHTNAPSRFRPGARS